MIGSQRPFSARELAARGITDHNTSKIVLVGCTSGYGGDFEVTIGPWYLIQEIWDTIYQSRPHQRWAASGFLTLKFYKKGDSKSPAVELLVNETSRCHFPSDFDNAFRCPGIYKILSAEQKREFEKRKSSKGVKG